MFEIIKSDLSGRLGILHTNHGKIETPAYVPVIHPVKQLIPTKKGIHDIINFDGAIMTDSGGYQVLEYGDVDVDPPEMAKFE